MKLHRGSGNKDAEMQSEISNVSHGQMVSQDPHSIQKKITELPWAQVSGRFHNAGSDL